MKTFNNGSLAYSLCELIVYFTNWKINVAYQYLMLLIEIRN